MHAEDKAHYCRTEIGHFSTIKQYISLNNSQPLLTFIIRQGEKRVWKGRSCTPVANAACKHAQLLFASNPDAKLSCLIRSSFGGKLWLK